MFSRWEWGIFPGMAIDPHDVLHSIYSDFHGRLMKKRQVLHGVLAAND